MSLIGRTADHGVRVLNGLIETTIDSVDGYRRAADEVKGGRFSAAFADRAREREAVVALLRDEVRRLGGTPEEEGSLLAGAHRAFLSLRNAVAGQSEDSVVAEVDHGESYLKGKWQAALNDSQLAPETRQLVEQCYESVRRGYEEWRQAHRDLSSTGTSAGGAFEAAGGTAGAARSSS